MAGDLKVSNGSSYVATKTVAVSNGSSYVTAKGVYVSNGAGGWILSWPNLSTAAITGPAYVVSDTSGGNQTSGLVNTIKPAIFSITLSNPTAVANASLQMSYQGGAWVQYGYWTSPAASFTHSQGFSTVGAWSVRVVITHANGSQVTSNSTAITCMAFSIACSGEASPAIGVQTSVTAGMSPSAPAGFLNIPEGWWFNRLGAGWQRASAYGLSNTNIPVYWTPGDDAWHDWVWVETFPDGSRIHSNVVRQSPYVPVPTHFHEVVPSGSSGAAIQAAMDRAYNWFVTYKGGTVNFDDENSAACVELQAGGGYNLGGTVLRYRRGVRLFSNGVGESRAYVRSASIAEDPGNAQSHLMNCDNNGGGNYWSPHYDWQVQNIRFDCMNHSGGISTTHTSRFRINNCHFWGLGPVKHYLEINSSGGYPSGEYNCQVYNTEFGPSQAIAGRRTEDECIQLDYSWPGAAPATANDGTVTNNVVVQSCWFHHVPRAIGSHHYQTDAGNAYPKGIPSHIYIDSNTFSYVDPMTYGDGNPNGATSEGAVRAYVWSNVNITRNQFWSCFQPINMYIPGDAYQGNGHPTYTYIAQNTLNDTTSGRYGIYGNADNGQGLRFNQVLIESNNVRGGWTTTPDIYFVGCDNTTGALGGVSEGLYIRTNSFAPSNMTVAQQKAYNKYRGINTTNLTGGVITGNTVGDGSVDNS